MCCMRDTHIRPLVIWYISSVAGFASLWKKKRLACIQQAEGHVCQAEIKRSSNIQLLMFQDNVGKEGKRVPEWEADGRREKETGPCLKARWSCRQLGPTGLNGPLVGASIAHWAIKGAPLTWSVTARSLCMSPSVTAERVHITEPHHKCTSQSSKEVWTPALLPRPPQSACHPPCVTTQTSRKPRKQKGETQDSGWLPAEQQHRCAPNPAGAPTMDFIFRF